MRGGGAGPARRHAARARGSPPGQAPARHTRAARRPPPLQTCPPPTAPHPPFAVVALACRPHVGAEAVHQPRAPLAVVRRAVWPDARADAIGQPLLERARVRRAVGRAVVVHHKVHGALGRPPGVRRGRSEPCRSSARRRARCARAREAWTAARSGPAAAKATLASLTPRLAAGRRPQTGLRRPRDCWAGPGVQGWTRPLRFVHAVTDSCWRALAWVGVAVVLVTFARRAAPRTAGPAAAALLHRPRGGPAAHRAAPAGPAARGSPPAAATPDARCSSRWHAPGCRARRGGGQCGSPAMLAVHAHAPLERAATMWRWPPACVVLRRVCAAE